MIEICIGSACHLKGSYQAIQRMKVLLEENRLTDQVELKSSFCLGSCGEGVSIRLKGETIHSVNIEEMDEFFETHIRTMV